MSRSRRYLLLLATAAWLAACGGMSGDDIGNCTDEKRMIADDEAPSELGFSARQVFAWAQRSETQRVEWTETPRVSTSTGTRTGDVQLGLTRGRGSAVAAMNDCEATADGLGLVTRLEVPVELTLAGDEIRGTGRLEGVLTARREGFAFVDASDDVAKKLGLTLTPRSSDLEIYAVHLRVALTERGSSARLGLGVQRRRAGSLSDEGGSDVVLGWPVANPCPIDTVVEEVGTPAADWWERVTRASEREWQGTDSQGMRAYDVSIEPPARTICVGEDRSVTLPATLRLTHRDAGDLAIVGYFEEHDGIAEFALATDRAWGGSPSNFAARFPSLGIDARGFDHVELSAELSVGAESAGGAIEVTGYLDTCQPQCTATGCSGCGPASRTSLARIELSPTP